MFAHKGLSSVKRMYSNIKREALGILHGFEIFHHYCFAREVSIIADHKPLVAIFKKDVATLSQKIQLPDLFIIDWLSRHNHTQNKDTLIPCMQLNIDAT